jgi:Predicted RNA-binding protein homologous to eukaryotic snRNP
MPLDAVCLQAVVRELRPQLEGVRIDKVQQPVRDQVILLLRGNKRLLLNAGASSPRIQLTELLRDNPAEPPMFCMLLRKHLVGGHVAELHQPNLERLAELEVDVTDDFGQPGKRWLVLEAMGRHSNLILLDGERRIIDCLRRVDAEMSGERQVLPGLFYSYPPTHGKEYFTDVTEQQFYALLEEAPPETRLDGLLLDRYFGISPLIAREIVFQTAGETDARLCGLGEAGRQRFWTTFSELQETVKQNNFIPICLRQQGKPVEFSYLPIAQYGSLMESCRFGSFSALMDEFYEARETQERIRQRGQDLVRTANSALERLRRKLALQEKDYAATQDRDRLRLYGDLITANLYRMERGPFRFQAENFYDAAGGTVEIPLDPLLTPQQNAAKYYKRYTKAKTAERYLREQMELARSESAYLESVLEEIREAETEQDFLDIRGELREAGYLRGRGREKKEMKRAAKPREFRTSGGFRVLVGRNNHQNDRLTLKDADRRDLWFHTRQIHGSHAVLCTQGREPGEDDLLEAARLAAYYSQARESRSVPVDYTPVKNVRKPSGGRPGMVIYSNSRTLSVTPDAELVKRLQVK